jgi:hypothetical protein
LCDFRGRSILVGLKKKKYPDLPTLILKTMQSETVPNIDQMSKEIKKIVDLVGNKHGNGDKFLDFADLFSFCHKKC